MAVDIPLAEFEAAVLVVTNLQSCDTSRLKAATAYIQEISTRPDAHTICMQLLYSTKEPSARFFALQALDQFIGSASYTSLDMPARIALREQLMGFIRHMGPTLLSEPAYVLNKLAEGVVLAIRQDYPEIWPTAITELASLSSDTTLGMAGLDMFCRIQSSMQTEIVDPSITRTAEATKRNTVVKDAIRLNNDISTLAQVWLQILTVHGTAVLTNTPTDKTLAGLLRSTLNTIANYAEWIDVRLVADASFVTQYARLLQSPYLRAGCVEVLIALVQKGMNPESRLALLHTLRLVDLVTALVLQIEAVWNVLSVNEDHHAPYGSTNSDDDIDFGSQVAHLVAHVGIALLTAGEDPATVAILSGKVNPSVGTLSGQKGSAADAGLGGQILIAAHGSNAMNWLAAAIRTVTEASMRLFNLATRDYLIGVEIVPFLHHIVTCLGREKKAAQSVADGIDTPVMGNAASSQDSSTGFGSLSSISGMPREKAEEPMLALPAEYVGKPAGVSCSEFMVELLRGIVRNSAYPLTYEWTGGTEEDDPDEMAHWYELRDEVKRTFINIVRIAPHEVTSFLSTFNEALGSEAMQALQQPQLSDWRELEARLQLVFWYGEGAPGVTAGTSPTPNAPADTKLTKSGPPTMSHPFAPIAIAVLRTGVGCVQNIHGLVTLAYWEVAARYAALLPLHPELLGAILEGFTGPSSLRNPNPAVRSRSAYLLLKLTKVCVRSPLGSVLVGYVDPLFNALGSLLAVPFLTDDVTFALSSFYQNPSLPTTLPPPSTDFDSTRGPTNIGSTDAAYLFETAGCVLGAPWVDHAKRIAYTEALLGPLLNATESGLQNLYKCGMTPAPQSQPHIVPPPNILEHVIQWISRSLGAIGAVTKGLGTCDGPGLEKLAALAERGLVAAMQALFLFPSNSSVRSKALFLLHRMVDCLATQLLPKLPAIIPPLLASCPSVSDMISLLAWFVQLANKFKQNVAPLLATSFLATIDKVLSIMPPIPPTNVPILNLIPTPGSRRQGAATSKRKEPESDLFITTDEFRLRVELQKSFANFILAIINNHCANDIFLSSQNVSSLPRILETLTKFVQTATDAALIRTCYQIFTLLVKQWLPITPGTANTPPQSAPPVLPKELIEQFAQLCLERILSAAWVVVVSPAWNTSDAQCHLAILDSISLQATIIIHVALASGGTYPAIGSSGGIDAIATMTQRLLPSYGVPESVASGYGGVLRKNLTSPRDVKQSFLVVAKYISRDVFEI